jgi:hypothetical protein
VGAAKGATGRIVTAETVCWFCGAKATGMARLVPMARGGSARKLSNKVSSCQRCVRLRSVMNAAEFREVIRRTLVAQDRLGPHDPFRFVGEGGTPWKICLQHPGLNRAGRPRKPLGPGDRCWCGRWIPAAKLEKHLKNCRVSG